MHWILFAALLPAIALAQGRPDQSPEAVASEKAKQDLLWQKMTGRIEALDRSFVGAMGVAIADLTDGRFYGFHADEIFPTCSSIKIAILAELARTGRWDELYTVDKKDLVDESIVLEYLTPGVSRITNRDLAMFMIVESDNGATNVLIDRLGLLNINATLEKLGLKQTRLRRRMIDIGAARAGNENTSTPREMTQLLDALYHGRVAGSEQALQILKHPKRMFFPPGLPAGIVYANKPGSLEGVRTDSAIIYAPGRPFLLSVMTTYVADEAAAEKLLATIAGIACEHFQTLGSASAYGRKMAR